jgi:hypothetical protein
VEGILRQAADVEEVDRRLQEYEQGFCGYLVCIFFIFSFSFVARIIQYVFVSFHSRKDRVCTRRGCSCCW